MSRRGYTQGHMPQVQQPRFIPDEPATAFLPQQSYHPQDGRPQQEWGRLSVAPRTAEAYVDLGILGPVRAGEQGEPAEDAERRQVSQS